MADIGQMLDTLMALDGVEAAVVAGRDGLLIDGRQTAHNIRLRRWAPFPPAWQVTWKEWRLIWNPGP